MSMLNGLEDKFVVKNNKKLLYGYTTGSCAAAASKAAAYMLITGRKVPYVELMTPKGIKLNLEILEQEITDYYAMCAVKKYSGDDPDITNGILIFSKVSRNDKNEIIIDGGIGVGRVTKPGLDQPVGNAAINHVPRNMIEKEVKDVCDENDYQGGLDIIISIPEGERLAKKTFNPRLGITGGISVLGTSGIVEPMSEAALIESMRIEMRMLAANGAEYLLISPGNYGVDFTRGTLKMNPKNSMKCSNYIGETIDMAVELGIKGILFVSHIGKFVKLAGGIMNTHSRCADSRMEILSSNAVLAGGTVEDVRKIMACVTTDEAIEYLNEKNLTAKTMELLCDKIHYYLNHRAFDEVKIGAIIFSNVYGQLGETEYAKELIKEIR